MINSLFSTVIFISDNLKSRCQLADNLNLTFLFLEQQNKYLAYWDTDRCSPSADTVDVTFVNCSNSSIQHCQPVDMSSIHDQHVSLDKCYGTIFLSSNGTVIDINCTDSLICSKEVFIPADANTTG